jgi:RimJ/RimL family protein N-acetyltransferase
VVIAQEEVVGAGHFSLAHVAADVAEVGLAVRVDWQGRGLSKLILAALMEAAERVGIKYLGGFVAGENTPVWRLLASLGVMPQWVEHEGAWWVEITTDPDDLPPIDGVPKVRHYYHLLRAAT